MNDRLVILGGTLLFVAATLWFLSDEERVADLRESFGLKQPLVTDVERVDPEVIEAEVVHLASLPVPGMAASEDGTPLPEAGEMAEAAVDCVGEIGAVLGERGPNARRAAVRYQLVLAATATDPETPLLERRLVPLGNLVAQGPEKVAEITRSAAISPEDAALLTDFHETYSRPEHPLYHGLQLYENTLPALDFGAILQTLKDRPLEVLDCALARFAPKPAEEAEPAAGSPALTWTCDDGSGPVTTLVVEGDPASLKLQRGERIDSGVETASDTGRRFEGAGWAISMTGEAALIESEDGGVVTCELAGNGG